MICKQLTEEHRKFMKSQNVFLRAIFKKVIKPVIDKNGWEVTWSDNSLRIVKSGTTLMYKNPKPLSDLYRKLNDILALSGMQILFASSAMCIVLESMPGNMYSKKTGLRMYVE